MNKLYEYQGIKNWFYFNTKSNRMFHKSSWIVLISHANKQTNKQTNKQPNKQTNNPTNKQTTQQTNKQPNKQTNKQTNNRWFIMHYTPDFVNHAALAQFTYIRWSQWPKNNHTKFSIKERPVQTISRHSKLQSILIPSQPGSATRVSYEFLRDN